MGKTTIEGNVTIEGKATLAYEVTIVGKATLVHEITIVGKATIVKPLPERFPTFNVLPLVIIWGLGCEEPSSKGEPPFNGDGGTSTPSLIFITMHYTS